MARSGVRREWCYGSHRKSRLARHSDNRNHQVLINEQTGKVELGEVLIRFEGDSLVGPLDPRPILHFREVAVLL